MLCKNALLNLCERAVMFDENKTDKNKTRQKYN